MNNSNDLISREAAIEAVYYKPSYKMAIEVLKEVPAVDAVPVIHAHWIEVYTDIMCSHCHATYKDEMVDMYQDSVDHRRYVGLEHCPHCGSIMSGDDEDD